MPKLAELIADRAEAHVPLDHGSIAITYRPKIVTPKWQEQIAEAERQGDLNASLYEPLAEALISWDLERDDGTPYPLTREGLQDVPKVVLTSVLVAVLLAARPNLTRLADSSNGSSATDGSAGPVPIGTRS